MRIPQAAAWVAALALLASRQAVAAVLIPIVPVSGSTSTAALGINDQNQIAGGYYTADGIEHGFIGTLEGQYTTFDLGTSYAEARSLNNSNTIVGQAFDKDGTSIGFERSPNGSVKTITIHGEAFVYNLAQGINAKGRFVGSGYGPDSQWRAYYGQNGAYRADLAMSMHGQPTPRGINDSNVVVGDVYSSADQLVEGFVLNRGVQQNFSYPDKSATVTVLEGINRAGMTAGTWTDAKGRSHAFAYDSKTATIIPINIPHSRFSQGWGLNKAGMIAVGSDKGPFIYCLKKKACPRGGLDVADLPAIKVSPRFATTH